MFGKEKRSPSSSPGLTLHSTHLARRRSPFGMVRALEKASDGLSSSKWPPNQPMCMHHELSYALEPPGLMLFACLQDDGTDIYWARSRVIEYLSTVRGMLPEGVNPVIGPDATGVGWIENISLKTQKGTPVYVKNVGTVHLGPDIRRGVAELNGEGEVVGGIVVMRYGENALRVIDGIKKKLAEIKPSLPEGVELVTTYDRSQLIKRSIATLREKLIEESIVVALVCLVFLWHIWSALVAIITLPIAIILSFLPMYWLGPTSNIMSLGGIAIAIGAMVDSAIIMVENAHKFLEHFREEKGRDPTNVERIEVILTAAKSVGRPLFFALLVITVSFIPVFSLEAQEGRLFKPLAFTKTF